MRVRITTLSIRALVCALVFACFLPVLADEAPFFIPGWFDAVHQYWQEGLITDDEFANAISYLKEHGVLRLLGEEDEPIADFVDTYSMKRQIALGHSGFSDCSSGWYITGYFTPLESDYSGKFVTVSIDGISYKFREDFATEIKTEGWGRAVSGKYLGWYDESFHLSEKPLDAAGNALEVNAAAVDPSVIPANTRFTIPSLPTPWDVVVFTGSDTGSAIIGKHIDVYTGEGKNALDEAYRITEYDNIVCLEAK